MRNDRASLAVFAGLVSFHALVQVFCVWTGALGVTLTQPLAIVVAVGAVILSWLFASRLWNGATSVLAAIPARGQRPARGLSWFVHIVAGAVVLWMLIVWIRLWFLAYQRPSYDWDGLYYHLPAMHGWVRAGHVAWLETIPDVLFVNFPMGVEAHAFFMHQLLHVSRIVDACNLWYWPLAFFSLVVVATRLGARGIWAWLAGGLIVAAPVFVSQSASSYIDPGFSSCVMAAVAASLVFVFDTGRPRWLTATLWGAAVGLTLGAKGTGVAFTLVVLTVVPVAVRAVHGGQPWRAWLLRCAWAVCVVLAVGGYWYARNAIHTGNPVFPIQVKLGEIVLLPGFLHSVDPLNIPAWLAKYPAALRLPISWLQLDAPIHGFDPVGGMGYVWPCAALPAILLLGVLAAKRAAGVAARPFTLAAILALLLLAVQPGAWWARYTVWLHVLGLSSLVVVLQLYVCARRRTLWRATAAVALIAVSGIAIWESNRTLAIEVQTGRVASPDGRGSHYASTAEMLFGDLAHESRLDQWLAADRVARSWCGRFGILMAGIATLPLGQREISVLPRELGPGDVRALCERGVRWVLWDLGGAGPVPEVLRQAAQEEHVYPAGDRAEYSFLLLPRPCGKD